VKSPFFSPDGRWVGVFHAGVLKTVPVEGGGSIAVCPAPSGHGGAWNAAGTIVFASSHNSALWRVNDQGGVPEPLTTLDGNQMGHYWPTFLDDQTVLFTAVSGLAYDTARIEAVRLDTKTRHTIVERAYSGHLLGDALFFARGGVVMRAAFDRGRLDVTGEAVPVVRDVRIDFMGPPELAVAGSGLLAYVPGRPFSPDQRLVIVDRGGAITEVPGLPQSSFVDAPVFSPDGRRIAYSIGIDDSDIWVHDLDRRVFSRITNGGVNRNPAWSPDGRTIAYATNDVAGRSRIMLAAASGDGTSREIANRLPIYTDMSFAPDGQSIVFAEYEPQRTMFDIWRLPIAGGSPQPILVTPAFEHEAQLHPNGRWLTYVSTESGPGEVYVRSMEDGAKWRISTNGGGTPVWSRDGRELFYRVGRRLMVAAVSEGTTFMTGDARELFDLPGLRYDVAPGGTRFVSIKESSAPPSNFIRVIANWQPAPK
jgi:WD40 repeat protein